MNCKEQHAQVQQTLRASKLRHGMESTKALARTLPRKARILSFIQRY
jgi:hypothetical protein